MILKRHPYLVLIIVWVLLAGGCQSQPPPTPTLQPTATFTPPPPTPTLAPLNLKALKTYTNPQTGFTIDYPQGWQTFEQANRLVVLSPDSQAGYSVVYNDVGARYDQEQLEQYLFGFIAQNFAGEGANFEALSQTTRPDGSPEVRFASVDPDLGPAIHQMHLTQAGSMVFVIYLSAAENAWEHYAEALQQLGQTFVPPPATQPTDATEPTPTPPSWTLIGPTSQEFGFLYASNWQIETMTAQTVTVQAPANDFTFSASRFAWPGIHRPQAARQAALAHIDSLEAAFTDVEHLPPTPFPLDTVSGSTIDFIYTTAEGVTMAGSVITAVNQGYMHKIVFTAPTELYDAALQWFNPMHKSFKFLAPDAGLDEADSD